MPKPVYLLFWLVLLFAPLALGTTVTWAKTVVEALCLALFLFCRIHTRMQDSPLYVPPGRLPVLLLIVLPLVQVVPLPPLILKLLSPNSWDIYAETIWVVRPGAWMPISAATKETLAEFFRFASYGAFYLVTVQLLAQRERLKQTVSILSAFAAFFALCGGVLYLFSDGRILWYLGDWQGAALLAGANKDHFAGFAAMLLPVILGYFLAIRPQVTYLSLSETAKDFLRQPRSHPHLLLVVSMLLLVGTLLLSASAAGLVSSLSSLLVFIVLLLVRGGRRKKRLWGALAAIAVLFSTVFFSWGLIWSDQFRNETPGGQVVWKTETIWHDTLEIVGDFPLLGTGIGAFETVYPRYKTVRTADLTVTHAGNDYLEQLAEGGIAGIILLGWFMFSLLRQSFPPWRKRHNRTAVYLYLGSIAGIGAALIHSWSDFVRSINAFGLYGFFLAGLAVAAAHTRSRGEGFSDMKREETAAGRPALIGMALLLVFNLLFNLGILAGQNRYDKVAKSENIAVSEAERTKMADLALQAARFDPLEAEYRYYLGDHSLATGNIAAAIDHFGAALRRDSMDAEYLQRIAMVFGNHGEKEKAERLLHAGVANDRSTAERHKIFAFWLLDQGRRKEGLEQIRQAISWDPERTREFLTLMSIYGLEDEEMRRILPQQAVPLLAYGDYLISVGKQEVAEENYRAAIQVAIREKRPDPLPFERISEYYTHRRNFSEALEIIQAGIERFPEKAEFRLMAGLLYEELGISYRAVEEYRRSLILDPESEVARERLEKLAGSVR